MNTSLCEQLLVEADRERMLADGFEGCSYFGIPPSQVHRARAQLLELAASVLSCNSLDQSKDTK